VKAISLTQGQVAIVDDEDYEELAKHKWQARWNPECKTWYAWRMDRSSGACVNVAMHRQILNAKKPYQVDHADHNGLNNRRHNIRVATAQQNGSNRRVSQHSSKYKGVCWESRRSKWLAQIGVGKKNLFVGRFASELKAAEAYDEAAKKYHGEFALLNKAAQPCL
jgi:hypothetical protein